jgi:dTDP-4-dehydrorhamnose 3,5-epimerase
VIVHSTVLPGVQIIEPRVFRDARGFFVETFHAQRYRDAAAIEHVFVQDNQSRSLRGVLRGLHAQKKHPQGKLVRVSRGAIFDVAVDIDPSSATFGKWVGVELNDDNNKQMWIPPGYAHGFVVLSDVVDFQYKCTDFYHPEDEIGVIWNDPDLGIEWPVDEPIVSERDSKLPTLAEFSART